MNSHIVNCLEPRPEPPPATARPRADTSPHAHAPSGWGKAPLSIQNRRPSNRRCHAGTAERPRQRPNNRAPTRRYGVVPGRPALSLMPPRIGRSACPVRGLRRDTPIAWLAVCAGARGHNDRVDIGEVLGAVDAELGGRWQVERRLAGGWNEGAYLLVGGGGSRAVLKWRASDPERLLGARELVEAARARGWPAPEWLAAGQAPSGEAWVVQEFIDGRTPPRLDTLSRSR